MKKAKPKRMTEAQLRRQRVRGELAVKRREGRRDKYVPCADHGEFVRRCHDARIEYGEARRRKIVKKEHELLFDEPAPNGATSIELIHLKVSYEHHMRAIKDGRAERPTDWRRFKANHKAAQRMDPSALQGDVGGAVRIQLKVEQRDRERARAHFASLRNPEEGSDMAKKKKKKKTAAKKRKVAKVKKTKVKKAKRAKTRRSPATLPKAGTKLTKKYKGKTVTATVVKNGFRCGGKVYSSLTAAALAVTGYKKISGPAFFGLK